MVKKPATRWKHPDNMNERLQDWSLAATDDEINEAYRHLARVQQHRLADARLKNQLPKKDA